MDMISGIDTAGAGSERARFTAGGFIVIPMKLRPL